MAVGEADALRKALNQPFRASRLPQPTDDPPAVRSAEHVACPRRRQCDSPAQRRR